MKGPATSSTVYLDTEDKISETRHANMWKKLQRGERDPSLVRDSNGDSSGGSGNKQEDLNNGWKDLSDWKYQI